MKHLNFSGTVANEAEDVSGVAQDEIEYAIYGRMTNPAALREASEVIYQLQSAMRGAVPGSQLRVRKSQGLDPKTDKPLEDMIYILTGKKPSSKHEGLDEVSEASSEDMLQVFLTCSGEYLEKTRYVLPITDMPGASKWEVDVFKDADGKPCEWVKVDLEIKQGTNATLSKLPPLGLVDVIVSRAGVMREEDRPKVAELYSKYFTKKVQKPD